MYRLFQNRVGSGELRLDAAESNFLKRQLEYVDTQTYKQLYANMIGRTLVPTKSDIPVWAQVHTWREMDLVGTAKIITSMGDDLPRADVSRRETTKFIKMLGSSYGYNWDELQAAAAFDTNLEADRAFAARFAIETQIDILFASGQANIGLEGLLNITGSRTFTLGTKAKGGLTWGTIAAPNATGEEVAADLMGIAADANENSQGLVQQFDILLPIGQYNYAAQKRLTATDSTKALAFALTSPFIRSIKPWFRCKQAGAASADRIACYANDPMMICGVVPLEYTPQPAQQRNLEWVVNTIAKCGGVCARYPFLVSYADGS